MAERELSSLNSPGPVYIFTGAEGTGKSTHAKLFAESCGFTYISYGDIVRDRARTDTSAIGNACRDALEKSNYLELGVLKKIVTERLSQQDVRKGAVIEGALRIDGETEIMPEIIENSGHSNEKVTVVALRTPIWDSVKRLTEVRKRDGDTNDGVLNRLGGYYGGLGERMSLAKKQWGEPVRIFTFNRDIESVQKEIREKLSKKKGSHN